MATSRRSCCTIIVNASVDARWNVASNDGITTDDGTTLDDATRNDGTTSDDGTTTNDVATTNDAATYVPVTDARLPTATLDGSRLSSIRLSSATTICLAYGSSSAIGCCIPVRRSSESRECNILLSKVSHATHC